MLCIKPVSPGRLAELCARDGRPASRGCEAVQGGEALGHALYDLAGDTLVFISARGAGQVLDGLLRAGLEQGRLAGMARFAFDPALWESLPAIAGLGFPRQGEILAFFERGCGAKGL